MTDYMKEAERLLDESSDAVSDVVGFAQDPAGYSMRVEATRAALLAHIQRGAVPEGWQVVPKKPTLEMLAGGWGYWLNVMEPGKQRDTAAKEYAAMLAAAPAPDHFRDAAKMMAAPAEVPMPKPVAYGFGNTAITGHTNRLMMVRIDIPGGDQYAGAFWLPLVLADEAHTYGAACRAAGEAAGYARVLEWAVSGWKAEVENRPLENKNRRSLDDVWRQVVRFAGGDPDALLGPSHDAAMRGEVKP